MTRIFAEREVSRNAEFHDDGLSWMAGLRQPDDMAGNLHTHLRAHRKARKLSQEKVAEAIGVAFNTVSGWETGARTMDLKDLEKLAEFYGVHPAALLLAPDEGPKFEVMRKAWPSVWGLMLRRIGSAWARGWRRRLWNKNLRGVRRKDFRVTRS